MAIGGKYFMVRKMRIAWAISMLNQVLWVYLCYKKELWGLIPLSVFHFGMGYWGWLKWR